MMLNLNRFLKITATMLESVLTVAVNEQTGDSFWIFYGTWEAFCTAKVRIIHYLKCHPDITAIWVAIDDDTKLIRRQKPFVINWVGLCADEHYEVEVHGQWSDRITQKWTAVLTKLLGGPVSLSWI